MKSHRSSGRSRSRRIKIEKPAIQDSEDENLWKRVHQFSELIPHEPEPYLGRLREIKDEIRKGAYLQNDMVEETAARLAVRFMRPE